MLLRLFDGCMVAGLLKNYHKLSLASFLDYSSIVKQLLFSWLAWNVNGLGNIKQGWVPGGGGGGVLTEYIVKPSFNWD